ncbi:MAG: ABC transporter ATP-binding protein [Spirochaetales bacterium]|nr:ABC transporter ATP-binding protein [Spirochaetales bacterium]
MFEIKDLCSAYGDIQVLYNIDLHIDEGEVVALFGPNGHGKSTLLKAISAVHPARSGSILFKGQEIAKTPAHKIVELGIAYIPEERFLFPDMTVMENLNMGAYNLNARKSMAENLEFVFDVFPRLKERRGQLCSTLSGGEARMVAIARGLMCNASMLMVDEPSIGLSPSMKFAVFEAIEKVNREKNLTILIVEQEIEHALRMANRMYQIRKGRILFERKADEIDVKEIEKAYF